MSTNKKREDYVSEIREDQVLSEIAERRDTEDKRYISHDKAWESNSNT